MNKTIFCVVFILAMIFVFVGCSNHSNPKDAEDYLKNKYGENFYLYSSVSSSFDQPYDQIFLYSDSHPNDIVTVYYQNGKYTDNYYGILVYDKFFNVLDDTLRKNLKQYKFYYQFNNSNYNGLSNPENFEEDFSKNASYFEPKIFVYVKKIDTITENEFHKIASEFKNMGINGFISIYELSSDDYNSINSSNVESFLNNHYDINSTYYTWFRNYNN